MQAPHHTAQSWASYWSNKHDVPDKILAAARGDDYESDEDSNSESEQKKPLPGRRPKYKDSSTEDDDESAASEDEGSDQDGEGESDDEDDTPSVRSWKEQDMGRKGESFTDADLYITAKYIASFSNWEDASGKEKWEPYHERVSFCLETLESHSLNLHSTPNDQLKHGLNTTVEMKEVCHLLSLVQCCWFLICLQST